MWTRKTNDISSILLTSDSNETTGTAATASRDKAAEAKIWNFMMIMSWRWFASLALAFEGFWIIYGLFCQCFWSSPTFNACWYILVKMWTWSCPLWTRVNPFTSYTIHCTHILLVQTYESELLFLPSLNACQSFWWRCGLLGVWISFNEYWHIRQCHAYLLLQKSTGYVVLSTWSVPDNAPF